ncbi:MAG: Gfo/Idh/MocA family protein [Opitutaceae bacterium]
MNDLRLGVIGSGGRGRYLSRIAHARGAGARIVATCDVVPAVLARDRVCYGRSIFTTDDYRALLDQAELDAVIIASPDFLHEEQAVAALSRGLAVYLEKPMAISIAGCDRILRAAASHKARLYVGHNLRHARFVRKMKELIDAGAIGRPKACWVRHFIANGGDYYFQDWHAERRFSHGLLLQKAAHDIDIAHWLCGGYSRQVSAMGALTVYGDIKRRLPEIPGPRRIEGRIVRREIWPPTRQHGLNHRIDVEDLSQMLMKLDNGVLANYAQCHYTPDSWRNFTVIGTEGRIENFGDVGPDTTVRLWTRRRPGYFPGGDRVFRLPTNSADHGGADRSIIAEFLRFARRGGKTDTSPVAARESVATGYMATESLRAGGKPMRVPPPPAGLI